MDSGAFEFARDETLKLLGRPRGALHVVLGIRRGSRTLHTEADSRPCGSCILIECESAETLILRHPRGERRAEGGEIEIISEQLGQRSNATTARNLDHVAPRDVLEAIGSRD